MTEEYKKKSQMREYVYNSIFIIVAILSFLDIYFAKNIYIVLSKFNLFMYGFGLVSMVVIPLLVEISLVLGRGVFDGKAAKDYAEMITKKKTIKNYVYILLSIVIYTMNAQYYLLILSIVWFVSNKVTRDLYGKRLAHIIENPIW